MIFRKLSLKRLWHILNIMQLILNIPLMNLNTPSNVKLFSALIFSSLNLKVINTDFIMQYIDFFGSELDEEVLDGFSTMGFKNSSFV